MEGSFDKSWMRKLAVIFIFAPLSMIAEGCDSYSIHEGGRVPPLTAKEVRGLASMDIVKARLLLGPEDESEDKGTLVEHVWIYNQYEYREYPVHNYSPPIWFVEKIIITADRAGKIVEAKRE